MLKRVLSILVAAFFILLPGLISAKVKGKCYTCHTMHSSQDGGTKNYLGVALGGAPPNQHLLTQLCSGCHAPTDGSDNDDGDGASAGIGVGTPFVNDSDGAQLAGGFFLLNDLTAAESNRQHNISDLLNGNDDNLSALNIPGSATAYAILSCSSCHAGLGHHENLGTNNIDGATIATSFRFLSGVLGSEDDDWQYWTTSGNALGNHNFYSAENVAFAGGAVATTGTIDSKCAECHGYYHSRSADASGIKGSGANASWTRHPTDIAYPATGEYASYAPGTSYNANVPVGWTDYNPAVGGPAVICLSCHFAHGGPNGDMLRWSYASWPGNGETNGCFTCHSYKK